MPSQSQIYCEHGNVSWDCGLCRQSDKIAPERHALLGQVKENKDWCACGCGQPHNTAVSSTVRLSDGSHKVFWYRTTKCQAGHTLERNRLAGL